MSNTAKISKSSVADNKISGKKTIGKKLTAAIKTASDKKPKRKNGDPLTKRILIEAASVGFSKAAVKTMKVMGYNVIVKDGWIVKKFADGRIKKNLKIGNYQ